MMENKRKLLLLTELNSKREIYFQKAAISANIPITSLDWREYKKILEYEETAVIKLDAPVYPTVDLTEGKQMIDEYVAFLHEIKKSKSFFVNSPENIVKLLNKEECKKKLIDRKIPVTELIAANIKTVEELLELLLEKHIFSVFVKPTCYSGAAGIVALRIQPYTGKLAAYTSCVLDSDKIVNTKRINYITEKQKIYKILNQILSLGTVVERWRPKAEFNGKSYDLRVVWQFGKIAFIVVRQSNSPITNLHLNNQALEFANLGLLSKQYENIEEICCRAVEAFSGLSVAGIDILIDKNNGNPYIIEMNGQGDLIYQDIYAENSIYQEQVQYMWKESQNNDSRYE